MRLLNTTSLKLEYFVGHKIPKYSILSHRWEDEEILFEDVQTDQWPQKKGVDKVKKACLRAKDDGFRYIWIDTCCIDKSSSAELSEAINSMFNWYHHSQVCYAYLFDVPTGDTEAFTKSEWFTRGWTLQELIAPKQVQFFDRQWRKIGDRLSLLEPIVRVTAIDRRVLDRGKHHQHCPHQAEDLTDRMGCICGGCNNSQTFHPLLSSFSVAVRMSWASNRVTTRVEDEAYALMGLFNVNMPLLYGEGMKAFRRLQEEITRNSNDQSILAGQHHLCFQGQYRKKWDERDDSLGYLFPPSPRAFQQTATLERPSASPTYLSMTLTNRCLNIELHVCPCLWKDRYMRQLKTGWLGILACVYSDDYLSRPAIILERLSSAENGQPVFARMMGCENHLLRISPGRLLDGNREVEYDKEGVIVWFNPSHIEMMNVDLLIHRKWAQGIRTPAIRINPMIGGHIDMAYRIRISVPELEETPNGCDLKFMVRKPQELQGNMPGILALDDGSGRGFFVAYGILVHRVTDNEAPDSATSLKFVPWCRLLAWRQVVTDREFIPKDDDSVTMIFRHMTDFISPHSQSLESIGKTQTHDSQEWFDKPGLRAQVAMKPYTFLGQTVYELEISVWRIDSSSRRQGSGHGRQAFKKRTSRHR